MRLTSRRVVLGGMGLLALLCARPGPPVGAQAGPADPRRLLETLTPVQRVGQLFLVPVWGAEPALDDAAARLLRQGAVGGVILDPGRANFVNDATAPAQVAQLTNALQRAARSAGLSVPLLVGLVQLGDAFPDSQLWGGMTSLPSQMALGATWDEDRAEAMGAVVGDELAAVGVNLLLAPTLDVAQAPRLASSGDLGVRTFGGSPAWVARLGQRFVAGVHRGSGGRVATAAGSFPGVGGADRSQVEALPVVESTLSDLVAVELLPFAAVTGAATRDTGRTDALLTSHVRFRGVQQQADRPVSLDSGGLRYLWAQLPVLTAWRADQGLLVSPSLGAPAVRRYLDPAGGTLNARRVVREALLAGNDLLTATELGPAADPPAQQAAILDAMAWLVDEYERDQGVRDAVDEAALRVLTLKQRLGLLDRWPLVDANGAARAVGGHADEVSQLARAALTQIVPTAGGDGRPAVPSPLPGERVLLVVDARQVLECPDCQAYWSLDPQRLVDGVRQVYGPGGSGRLTSDEDVAAITYGELKAWLQASGRVRGEDTVVLVEPLSPERRVEVDRLLRRADWLVFAMQDVRPAEVPPSDALNLFLRADPPELAEAEIAVLAFGAPYYLDATEIARLSVYYALYSRTGPFLDIAVRALFGDVPAAGASPVSVPGARYDLARMMEPNPDQIPGLELVGWDAARPLTQGATLIVRTTTVRDRNGHAVPDGTRVRIRRYDRAEGVFLPDVDTTTERGRATAEMRADRAGVLEVTATFDNGLRSEPLSVTIEPGGLFSMPAPDIGLMRPRVPVDWQIFFLSLALMLVAGLVVFGAEVEVARTPGRMMRLVLLSLCWGLAGYLLVAAGGLHVAELGGVRLWPAGWNVAYQAPLLSFVLALLPVVWFVRSGRRRPRPAP